MAKPDDRRNARSVFAGMLVLGLVVLGLYVTTKAQTGSLVPTDTVKMAISDVHTLQVNDDLRVYSSRVGQVSGIEYRDGEAIVTADLISGAPTIYRNASAQVLSVSPLALKYLNLDPGTPDAGELGDGEIIPSAQNVSSSDLQDVLEVFDPETRAQATSTLRELGTGLGTHGQDINDFVATSPELLADLGTVSGTLASDEMDFTGMLSSVDRLASRFQGRHDQIRELVKSAESTFAAIGVDGGAPLQATMVEAATALPELRGGLASLETPLTDFEGAMRSLDPGGRALGEAMPDLRGMLRESVPVFNNVPGVADDTTPALGDLRDTFDDARPLAPKASEALVELSAPLAALAPYAPEIGQFFVRGHSFVSEGPADGTRYARLNTNFSLTQGSGGFYEGRDFVRDEYPEPGEATGQRATNLAPPGLIPAGGGR